MDETVINAGVFKERLGRFLGVWRKGLVLALLLRLAGWGSLAAGFVFLTDYFLGLSEGLRLALLGGVPIALLAAVAPEALRILKLNRADAARRADALGRHRRQEVLAAWELGQASGNEGTDPECEAMTGFLVRRSMAEAGQKLTALGHGAAWPGDLVSRRGRIGGVQLIVALAVMAVCGTDAVLTIVPRLLFPERDIPPFSRYVFDVRPDSPQILFGGRAEVSVTIRGAPVRSQVWLMTRRDGKIQKAACFQEEGGRYAQRLENVTAPLEFCFATGRARTRWHTVLLQLQPQILQAWIRVIPPAYTRLPTRDFMAGQEDLAGVKGTKVKLTLTSNRPLRDGTMLLSGRNAARGTEEVILGKKVVDCMMAFSWTLNGDAEVKAVIRDVQGTPTAEPLVLRQKQVQDESPKPVLSDPPVYSMATPAAIIKVAGNVEDDYGIEQVDLVRAVVGFQDRAVTLLRGDSGSTRDFETELDLAALGVESGQVLELYVEAVDNNPVLPGVGASEVPRIRIISDAEYAEILRDRETIERFTVRYEVAQESLAAVLSALDELHGLVLWRKPDDVKFRAVVQKTLAQHQSASTLFRTLEKDFSAFDLEKSLKKASQEVVGALAENERLLGAMRSPDSNTVAQVEGMLKRLNAPMKSMTQLRMDAALAAKLARVMDCAARYQNLVQRQEDLVRKLKLRFGGKVGADELRFLPSLGERQAELGQILREMTETLVDAAGALPDSVAKFKADSLDFARALEACGASNHMANAVTASRNSDARTTLREATLALEKLQSLLKGEKENGFASMCKGNEPDFGDGDLKKTLQEMFRSMCKKRGAGEGEGQGSGSGSGGEGGRGSGTGSEGSSPLGTKVYGAGRSNLGEGEGSRNGTGKGQGPGRGGSASILKPSETERIRGDGGARPAGETIQFERLPVKYRDAVKRYFQENREKGGLK